MEFINEVLGTNKYWIVLAGFVWSILGLYVQVYNSESKPTLKDWGFKIVGIFAFMRFYDFIFDLFSIEVTLTSTSLIGFFGGMIGVNAVEKLYNFAKDLFK